MFRIQYTIFIGGGISISVVYLEGAEHGGHPHEDEGVHGALEERVHRAGQEDLLLLLLPLLLLLIIIIMIILILLQEDLPVADDELPGANLLLLLALAVLKIVKLGVCPEVLKKS